MAGLRKDPGGVERDRQAEVLADWHEKELARGTSPETCRRVLSAAWKAFYAEFEPAG